MAVEHLAAQMAELDIEGPTDIRPFRIIFGSYSEVSSGEQYWTDMSLPRNLRKYTTELIEYIMSKHFFYGHQHNISDSPEGSPSNDPRMLYGQMFLKVVTPIHDGENFSFIVLQAGIDSIFACDHVEDEIKILSKLPQVTGVFWHWDYFDEKYWDAQRVKYHPYHYDWKSDLI